LTGIKEISLTLASSSKIKPFFLNQRSYMKKLKLKLDELKVQSFVTELNPGLAQTAKGGDDGGYGDGTQLDNWICKSLADVISNVVKSVIDNSGASKAPCGGLCHSNYPPPPPPPPPPTGPTSGAGSWPFPNSN
jgi:hypothetical protein